MQEFEDHISFMYKEWFRIIKPGRLVSIHCMNLPTFKVQHGYIGLIDFRGDLIRQMQKEGFIYHSEVCIYKDPEIAMNRTHSIRLLHNQLCKDSAISGQGVPDYLITINDTIPATFNYASTTLCTNYPNVTPTIVNPGGTFTSAPAGLVFVSAASGEIDLTASAPGVYTISYITAAVCPDTAFQSVTIQNTPSPAFNYALTDYCLGSANPTPTVSTPGGVFLSTPPGLVFVSTATGQINLATSTAGTYTISYITSGTCPDTATASITINDTIPVS